LLVQFRPGHDMETGIIRHAQIARIVQRAS
jgi:hypothetical protein